MKKLLSVFLIVVMLAGTFAIPVFADEALTLTVGEGKDYSTLEEAFRAPEIEDYKNIVYEIYGKQTLTSAGDKNLYENVYPVCIEETESVYFKGMDKTAEIFIDDSENNWYPNAGATGLTAYDKADVTFDSLIINHNKNEENRVQTGDDRLDCFWYIVTGGSQTYKNCTFQGNIICDATVAVFENCSFPNNKAGKYALFYRGGGDNSSLTIDGCSFEGTRAIKTYTDRPVKQFISEMTITDSTFAVTEKAAIENESNSAQDAVKDDVTLVFTGNTFKNCRAVSDAESIGTTLQEIYKNNTFVIDRPGASECFTATDLLYEIDEEVVDSLSAGDITAKTSVTNTQSLDLPVSVITAEYLVSENGFKTLLQVNKDSQVIAAGATADFENALTITETEGHIVKTIIVADDAGEPVGTAAQLSPAATPTEKVVFMGTEKDPDNIIISIYQINLV